MATAYDPYAQDPTIADEVKSYATAGFRPSTYVGMYATLPGLWSTSKGLWVPGVGKSIAERGLRGTAGRVFDVVKANPIKGTAGLGFEGFRRLAGLGMRGGGHVGETTLTQGKLAGQLYDDIYKQALSLYRQNTKYSLPLIERSAQETAKRALLKGNIVRGAVGGSDIASKANFKIAPKYLALKGTKNIMGKMTAAKFMTAGLAVGKVAAGVGMVMFGIEMARMIGEPLGRAAIRGLDNTLTRYQERFIPELGGQLEMSFLSRGAATERQRAIEAISKAHINGRSAFGQEASLMHR